MKPTPETEHHWVAAQLAAGNAETCLHFGLADDAFKFADRALDLRAMVVWEADRTAPTRECDCKRCANRRDMRTAKIKSWAVLAGQFT